MFKTVFWEYENLLWILLCKYYACCMPYITLKDVISLILLKYSVESIWNKVTNFRIFSKCYLLFDIIQSTNFSLIGFLIVIRTTDENILIAYTVLKEY